MPSSRVVHVIIGLNQGGAERSLYNLLSSDLSAKFSFLVVSLLGPGFYGSRIRALGVPVLCLNIHSPLFLIRVPIVLFHLALFRPSVIHGWMYHGNIAALFLRILFPSARLFWGVRTCIDDISLFSTQLKFFFWLNKIFSRFVNIVIYNSHRSLLQHKNAGYSSCASLLIYNGFDTSRWINMPPAIKSNLRSNIGIDEHVFVLGYVGRDHYRKNIPSLFSAFSSFSLNKPDVRLICVGTSIKELLPPLYDSSKIIFLETPCNMELIYPMFDFLCLSSIVEGFPNVLGEAMSCSVPCISTDVGDANYIISNTGFVVPPGNTDCLIDAIERSYQLSPQDRKLLGISARKRIKHFFTINDLLKKYCNLYK